jgi:hypothetical protein
MAVIATWGLGWSLRRWVPSLLHRPPVGGTIVSSLAPCDLACTNTLPPFEQLGLYHSVLLRRGRSILAV